MRYSRQRFENKTVEEGRKLDVLIAEHFDAANEINEINDRVIFDAIVFFGRPFRDGILLSRVSATHLFLF